MNQTKRWGRGGLCALALLFSSECNHAVAADAPAPAPAAGAAAANIIIVTIDGMRWQEVFGGFDPMLATEPSGGVRNPIPRVLKGKNDVTKGSFAVMHMDVNGKHRGDPGQRVSEILGESFRGHRASAPVGSIFCGH